MIYHIKVEFKVKNYKVYLTLIKEIDLPFHPNKGDQIVVDDIFCRINEVTFFIDDGFSLLDADEDCTRYAKSKDEAIKHLVSEFKELRPYGWTMEDFNLGNIKDLDKV